MCAHNTFGYLWLNGELTAIDQCLVGLVFQLNAAGIKTVGSCCGHGRGYPNITCVPGTEEALRDFGCKIIVTRQPDSKVEAYFPVSSFAGHTFVYEPSWGTLGDS